MSELVTLQSEAWPDGVSRTVWRRNASGRFELESIDGQPPHPGWAKAELNTALGCPQSVDAEDGGSQSEPAFFPPSFVHSPATGKKLERPQTPVTQVWLPPHGNHGLDKGLLRGGKLTRASLWLRDRYRQSDSAPPRSLAKPEGACRFLAHGLGLSRTFLFALFAEKGRLYCLMTNGEWHLMRPGDKGADIQLHSGLPFGVWNIETGTKGGCPMVIWPSDQGLLALRLSPLSMSYEVELLAEGRCVSPVLPLEGMLHCLLIRSGQTSTSLVRVGLDDGAAEVMLENLPGAEWPSAASTLQEAVWISRTGYVVVDTWSKGHSFQAWPDAGYEPMFDFGPPHFSCRDGGLWLQMLHRGGADDGGDIRRFLSIGQNSFRNKTASGPRHLTGKSVLTMSEQRMSGEPWDRSPRILQHQLDEFVMPVLDSMTDQSLLVFRVKRKDAGMEDPRPDLFFSIRNKLPTSFQIFEENDDNGFYFANVARPWISSAFIFEGHLHLYHPDFDTIPGWPLKNP